MKYIIFLCLSLSLISCGAKEKDSNPSSQPSKTKQESTSPQKIHNYNEVLDVVSNKVKTTPEFNSCLEPSITMCAQSAAMKIAQKNKSSEFCEELQNIDQKESCKFAIAMLNTKESKDIKDCESLREDFQKICTNQVYRAKALSTKDLKLCENLSPAKTPSGNTLESNERGQCIMSVILSDSKSTEYDCGQIGNKTLENVCKSAIKQRKNETKRK